MQTSVEMQNGFNVFIKLYDKLNLLKQFDSDYQSVHIQLNVINENS